MADKVKQYPEGIFRFKQTEIFHQFVALPHNKIALFTGNRFGKGAFCAFQYVMRILGVHPIARKNVLYFECPNGHEFSPLQIQQEIKDWICPHCKSELKIHERSNRIFRFASEVLPGQKEDVGTADKSAETRNAIYPEFKKWLPPELIKKDIVYRNTTMTIRDPLSGQIFCDKQYKGNDILVEFVAYSQTVQSGAGVSRLSIWQDEESPWEFYEEQLPRLIEENGDWLMSLTPATKITWTYDEIFEQAQVYVRTKAVCDFLAKGDRYYQATGEEVEIEETGSSHSIAVIQGATDDNPTLTQEAIEEKVSSYNDPAIIATRRYGVHQQATGRIFKTFKRPIHVIEPKKYFPDGIPHAWRHGRGIDFHPQTEWACGCMSLSPQNEAFIWLDYNPSPGQFTTKEICRKFASLCKDYQFYPNLIDPAAKGTLEETISVYDDINREFNKLKRESIGTGGYWQPWDTKGEKGRDAIHERLKNSVTVGKPFNNFVNDRYLPTLWILNNCVTAIQHMHMWSWDQYTDARTKIRKGETNKPMQKWSHFNMVWEALFKHPSFRPRYAGPPRQERKTNYFKGQ